MKGTLVSFCFVLPRAMPKAQMYIPGPADKLGYLPMTFYVLTGLQRLQFFRWRKGHAPGTSSIARFWGSRIDLYVSLRIATATHQHPRIDHQSQSTWSLCAQPTLGHLQAKLWQQSHLNGRADRTQSPKYGVKGGVKEGPWKMSGQILSR